ncbi:conserved hypothetical protein [Theileria orientalis strain Shintoku]|uniref:COG complex component COG2 C-terminal domain-containing protein n=1 Tax=Theileria orientalis strain Shintoku TaxID=869250 RepID=J7MEX7_THEOR|nr:conserved hypothetical protein [Theileria orientalis strain Shintoku]BAM38799.1 conserved hypothetical protein [Theileria orientalis strain Shintoku]|eukprot:XP_009689100.1 conserved hypothetical protein [Theileria orientalis strain Shintoku]
MDSKSVKDKTDSPTSADLYNESLDWIRSMNLQMKSPGNYISTRLESVSLEQLHREFSALLLSSQSHGTSLLRTAFTKATSYNDSLKKIIMSLWPVKDKVSDSYNFWKNVKDNSLQINEAAHSRLNRLYVISYTKLAIRTILQARSNFESLCNEIVETFSALHVEDISGKYYSKISHVIALVELISQKVYKMNTLIQNLNTDYNLESNWVLLEFAPKEIRRISNLIEKYKYYDRKIGEMLRESRSSKYIINKSGNVDCQDVGNVNLVIQKELNEFSIGKFEREVESLVKSLTVLTEVCANIAFSRLHKLYADLNTKNMDAIVENDDAIEKNRIRDEIRKYVASLVSIISGQSQLRRGNTRELVEIFNEVFLTPFLESNSGLLHSGSRNFLSLQEESSNFPKFVEAVEGTILNTKKSYMMRFLEDLSEAMGDEKFKSSCVLGPVAKAVLKAVEESYSSIFAPIYPECYADNYRSFERLLTALEVHSDSSLRNLLKWRGTSLPYNFATRFCTGVMCDNHIERVHARVRSEFEKHHELDGNYHKAGERRFFESSSLVVYSQAYDLLSERDLFYHLLPQYLKGLWEMFREYIGHVDGFIAHMESTNNSSDVNEKVKWPSGLSFAYSTYVLNDLLELLDALKTGSLRSAEYGDRSIRIDARFGSIAQHILKIVQKPLSTYLSHYYSKHTSTRGNAYHSSSNAKPMKLDNEQLRDIQNLFAFTIKAMQLICEFIGNIQDHINFVKDKLDQYLVNSLYNSSKCSLQFIQSLSSKYRTSNKNDTYQVSDYVKFLVAPMVSFNEFTQDIIPQELLKSLMKKTIELVSTDYVSHISSLVKSVENLNSSLMNPKNASLNEYSESFLIVDMGMLRRQIKKDVEEFYGVCVQKFAVTKDECGSLKNLLEYAE